MINNSSVKGFTLLELVIVVAIIGVLAAFVYPSYQDYVRDARRTEARSLLLEAASRQERFYTTQSPNSYAANMTALGYANNNQPTEQNFYQVSITPLPAGCAPGTATLCTTFTATATPINAQVGDGCGNLTLTNIGVKGRSGATPLDECW
jgi:type IV pilus assembly protein PilE